MICGGVQHFDVEKDVPDLSGKVCLVTGGNSGLGRQTVLDLAKHNPSEILLTARSATKAQTAIGEIIQAMPTARITFLELDLDSLSSVQQAAKRVLGSNVKLDILILNAGIMCTPPALTKDGYETQFGINHMAHALFATLLLPVLLQAPEPRVVFLSSDMQSNAPPEGIVFAGLKTTQEGISTVQRYGQSKLANILFAKALASHYPRLTVASVHPGVFRTNLQTPMKENSALINVAAKFFGGLMPDASKGTRNQLWAATSRDVKSGEYYTPVGVAGKGSKQAKDGQLAEKLWEWTMRELKPWSIYEQ